MPLTKVDYSKTIIYKIQHRDNDELIYVGSTTDLTRRKYNHKRDCYDANSNKYDFKVYRMIRDNGGFDSFNMLVIKEYPCNNKREAEEKEDKVMREMKASLNTKKAFITPEEKVENRKIYNELHKEKRKIYNELHIETILEYQKQYYELNKDKIAEIYRRHYELNNDKITELNKQYYNRTKEKKLEQLKQKNTCECGCVMNKSSLTKHKQSKKHQDCLNMTEQ